MSQIDNNNAGFENHKSEFLKIIHTNIRQLTDFMINDLSLPASFDEEILGREVAKVISYMAFGIDPLQVDVPADSVVNQFIRDTNNLTNISKLKNYKFYPLIKDNLNAVAACFGIYFITRVESIKGFAFVLPMWLLPAAAKASRIAAMSGEAVKYLDQLKEFIDSNFGVGDNGKDVPGGIYYFWKYFKNQPYFGDQSPRKEQCSIGFFKSWKSVIESESGMSFPVVTEYFLKYYPYIKSGYYKTSNEFYIQARKDIADIAAGRSPKNLSNIDGSGTGKKGFFARLFGR